MASPNYKPHAVASQDISDRVKWRAVVNRDARFDGMFVFAVRSTRIYCQPSCPARRPHPHQMVFYLQGAEAERAGFRPCRRCNPEQNHTRDIRQNWIRRVCYLLDSHTEEPITLAALSRLIGLSPHHLLRAFKAKTGVTPRQYAEAQRLRTFKSRLRTGGDITAALYESGFGSPSRLYEKSNARLGMTPRKYRLGGEGMQIKYVVVSSPLGRLLVAATSRGICALYMGDSDHALDRALRKEYPAAQIHPGDGRLRTWIKSILAHMKGEMPQLSLPLDLQATAFQMKVWQKLQQIPYGTTQTYSEVARALGQPTAARAVARACATNPVSIIIPCHRVVRTGGHLAGYRWGVKRKQTLLQIEQNRAPKTSRRT